MCVGTVVLHTKANYPYRSNILLDHKLTAKISDFGFSIQLPQSLGSKTLITSADGLPGTDRYRPPEYCDRKHSVLSDIYSFGVVRVIRDLGRSCTLGVALLLLKPHLLSRSIVMEYSEELAQPQRRPKKCTVSYFR